MILEGTSEFNRGFKLNTGEIPVTVHDGGDGMTPEMVTRPSAWAPHQDRMHDDDPVPMKNGAAMDPFADDTPVVAACDLSSPDVCESCQ